MRLREFATCDSYAKSLSRTLSLTTMRLARKPSCRLLNLISFLQYFTWFSCRRFHRGIVFSTCQVTWTLSAYPSPPSKTRWLPQLLRSLAGVRGAVRGRSNRMRSRPSMGIQLATLTKPRNYPGTTSTKNSQSHTYRKPKRISQYT